jgi:hypothetical protein
MIDMQKFDREDDEPLDPAVERVRQKMARLQLVSLGIMFFGLFAVFAVIIYKVWYEPDDTAPSIASENQAMVPGSTEAAALASGAITLPEGSRVLSTDIDGSNLKVRFSVSGEQSLWIVDLQNLTVLAKIELKTDG